MERPLLRSHPYLQGLNLLLRASGLTRVEGAGAKARLVVDAAMLVQWDQISELELALCDPRRLPARKSSMQTYGASPSNRSNSSRTTK